MSSDLGWTDLVAALLGAVAAGGFGILDRIWQNRSKRKAIRIAFKAHVSFLTQFIDAQQYETDARGAFEASQTESWEGHLFSVDIPNHYLDGLRELIKDVGCLSSRDVELLVEFTHRFQVFIDSTRPSTEYHSYATLADKRSHAHETWKNIRKLLAIGNSIVGRSDPAETLPSKPQPGMIQP